MDFHARRYDPQIGRFLSVDPLAEAINQADANAFIHDKEYDKEKASGLSGVLFNTKVLRADGKFIVAQMGVAFSRKTTVSEKFQAIVSGNIMTAVTMPKAFIYLGKYTINKFSMGTLFKP